ncbi:MAG: DUF1847 domain-containing protein [Proteobacteria bacterium]|nr:DUF1847 domain-containing protein [Pseudomonadota bacterium]
MEETQNNLSSICDKCPGTTCFPRQSADAPPPPLEDAPTFCPMRRFPEVMEKVEGEYQRPDIREFARLASIQEAQCYEITSEGVRNKFPRLEEIVQFAGKCNYRKIGIAFCVGLKEEMRMVSDILKAKGFEIVSVNCKVGGIPKESIGLKGEEKIMGPGIMETMCNPIAQAEILRAESVDLAIMLGLCVGHDTLFLKYCTVPCTVLAVKDRVLGHNPLAACYLSKSPYYGRMRMKLDKTGEGEKVTLPEDVRS